MSLKKINHYYSSTEYRCRAEFQSIFVCNQFWWRNWKLICLRANLKCICCWPRNLIYFQSESNVYMANTADKENYGVIMLHKKGLKLLHCRNMWCLLCNWIFYYCWTLNCRFCFEWGRLFWATSMFQVIRIGSSLSKWARVRVWCRGRSRGRLVGGKDLFTQKTAPSASAASSCRRWPFQGRTIEQNYKLSKWGIFFFSWDHLAYKPQFCLLKPQHWPGMI